MLILVEPERLSDLIGVIDVVDRYNPAAAVWQFDPAGEPRLRAVTADDLSHWRTQHAPAMEPERQSQNPRDGLSPAPASPDRPASPPGLRLAGEGPMPPQHRPPDASAPPHPHPDVKPAPRPETTQRPLGAPEPSEGAQPIVPLLSDEELAMLLSGDADQKR